MAIRARDALPAPVRHDLSLRISARIRTLAAWRNARCVLLYASFGSEFETDALIADALAQGKTLCLPRAIQGTRSLDIHTICDPMRELVSGLYGIREPVNTCPQLALRDMDFVLVPGVAFTSRCIRLGYGGGYYDRLLNSMASGTPKVAAAYALQMREALPAEAHDVLLDAVITEDAEYCAG